MGSGCAPSLTQLYRIVSLVWCVACGRVNDHRRDFAEYAATLRRAPSRADMFVAASTLKRSCIWPWCPSDWAVTGSSIVPSSILGSPSRISICLSAILVSLHVGSLERNSVGFIGLTLPIC